LEPEVIKKLKDDKKLPTRVDWISGNPKDGRQNRKTDDYEKTIFEIKADQTVEPGKIVRDSKGNFTYSGKFKIGNDYKAAADLTDADKKILEKDFNQERSNLTNEYPGVLAYVVPPPGGPRILRVNDTDADRDGVINGRDT